MSASSASPPSKPVSHDPEEVVRLSCPKCSGKLNLRRKHLGIAGACVHCSSPVMAVDHGGIVKLVDPKAAGQPSAPVASEIAAKPAVPEKAPVASEIAAKPAPPEKAPVASEPAPKPAPPEKAPVVSEPAPKPAAPEKAPVVSEPAPMPAAPEKAPVVSEPAPMPAMETAPEKEPVAQDPEPVQKTSPNWGFPEPEDNSSSPIGSSPLLAPAKAEKVVESPSPQPEKESTSFDFGALGEGETPPWDKIVAESGSSDDSAEPVGEQPSVDESPIAEIEEINEEPEVSSEHGTTPTVDVVEQVEETPAGSEEKIEEASVSLLDDDAFEFDAMPKKSALFSSNKEEPAVNSGWGTKVPTQNHASISPFSTGSATAEAADDAAPGFAEALFKEKPSSAGKPAASQSSPFPGQKESDSGSAAPSPFAKIGNPDEGDEPVVLDGDGRPMAPMTDEEKDAFAREMMQLGDYHKRSPWVKRIKRFVITVAVLIGGGYAAYLFMPADIAKDYKNKALAFLEPGSVLLDFLPVEIVDDPEGEEGDKMVKVKAIEGLNQLTDQMDGYLNQADENLRESGATVEEREKIEHMEGPNIPKLPFNVDLDKLKGQVNESAEASQAELDKQLNP